MELQLPDGAKHPVEWTIEYFAGMGIVLQPNQMENINLAWAEYVKRLDLENKAKAATAAKKEVTSKKFEGYATGETQNSRNN